MTKKEKECKPKVMNMMKIWNMIGSFVMTVARPFTNKRPTTNVKNARTTCYVRTVMTLLFISILYIRLLFLLDLVPLSNLSVQKYCQNYNPVKHVDVVSHKLLNTFHTKTELKMFNFCVIDATIKVH